MIKVTILNYTQSKTFVTDENPIVNDNDYVVEVLRGIARSCVDVDVKL